MMTPENVKAALDSAEPLFERLFDSYEALPETVCECDSLGQCCPALPEMTALEALGLLRGLLAMPEAETEDMVKKLVTFYLATPVRTSACPLLKDGGCSIYERRMFACRAYGMWSAKMGKARTEESRAQKKALRAMWKKYGIDLPPGAVEHEMDYCRRMSVVGGGVFPDKKLLKLLTGICRLDLRLDGFEAQFSRLCHSDFSLFVAALVFGVKKAVLQKFAVIRELSSDGGETRLAKALEQINFRNIHTLR